MQFHSRKSKGRFNSYVSYPVLTYLDSKLSVRVNARLRAFAEHAEKEYWWILRDASYDTPYKSFFVVSCSVAFASAAFVSVGCDKYLFDGGAHGQKGYSTLNLVLPTVQDVQLADLMLVDSASQEVLLQGCNRALANDATARADHGQAERLDPSLDPISFDAFTVTSKGLQFFFKNALAHVIADVVTPLVTWDILAPLLRSDAANWPAVVKPPFASADAPFNPWTVRGGEEE